MDFQQPHRYMRPPPPPPPSMVDLHHQIPQPRQPFPPPGTWYSNQFQYQPSQHSSPSPPPSHQQWPPPPPPPPHSDYPPYPAHPLHNNQYPLPPLPPRPPLPLPPHQIPQSYPQSSQDWGNPNWGRHQDWEYPAHNNEEDWAAKARAWAAAKAALDNQHPQSQFTPVGRLEQQNHYHDQYSQTVDPHYSDAQRLSYSDVQRPSYSDVQRPPFAASSYQQYAATATPPHRTPNGDLQQSASLSSGQSSYVPDGHLSYTARDGRIAGDSNAVFPYQESSSTSPSIHQQEVPSSYSSVAAVKEEAGDQNEKFYKSLPFPLASTAQHHSQLSLPVIGRSASMDQPHYAFANQSFEPTTDLSDQPLHFAPRFSHDHDPHVHHNYTHDPRGAIRGLESVADMPSIHAWTRAAAPGVVYSPFTSAIPPGPQVDSSVPASSSFPGHSAPLFGGIPGSSFQPPIPSVSGPFGISTGIALHPTTAFSIDAYGASGVPERPKKASVPNWLRDEIIKKKAVIASSALEFSKEETQSVEDDGVDKFLGRSDQADSKSIDSSRSAEDDGDEEDYVEAAKTAAINQEIKRLLTEVLLKVTDELFDEIATKVLNEDDLTVEVDHNIAGPNYKSAPSTPATPKVSAKVLIPAKTKDGDSDDVTGKYTSSSPEDVLGLASYASDDNEDDEIQSSSKPNSKKSIAHMQPIRPVENGSSQAGNEEHSKKHRNVDGDMRMSLNEGTGKHSAADSKSSDNRGGKDSAHGDVQSIYSSQTDSVIAHDKINVNEILLDGSDASMLKNRVEEKVGMKTEIPLENFNGKKSSTNDSQGRETRNKADKNDISEIKRSSRDRAYEKGDEFHGRQEERHVRKERTDDRNGSKEKTKEESARSGERVKGSDSKKRSSHLDVKDGRKETERDRRANAKEVDDRKREKTKDDKGERSRHKTSDSGRHKRHRSSSVGSRGRHSHANDSSDESSDDSKRKLHQKRRDLSPSPVRSRRRQVSRSPHSKHSHRRHSPYSSLETNRGRRSRSRSPVRRQR